MRPASRTLALNAICLYILGYLLTIILHEVGHATMSWVLGGQPVLYSTSVENTNKALSVNARVLIAAAGPVFSLVQGLLLLAVARRRQAAGVGGLLVLYLGVFGLINFLGYMLIAPFVAGGDTGQIAALLHIPAVATWLAAGAALVVLSQAIGRTGGLFGRLLPAPLAADEAGRTQGLRAVIAWPWLVGSVVMVLLSLPAPHPAVVANMFMSPMVLSRAYRMGIKTAPADSAPGGLLRPQWLAAAALVLVAVAFRLLARGLAW